MRYLVMISSPDNTIESIILRDASKQFRSALSSNIVNTVLAFATSVFLVIIPFGISWSNLWIFQAVGLTTTVYSAVVYWRFKAKPSTSFTVHCLFLAVLGFLLAPAPAIFFGGLLYGFAGYQMASVRYWMRQGRNSQLIRCTRDGGEVAVFGGTSLVCTKCSRLLKVGFDVPVRWRNIGLGALIIGVVLRIIVALASRPIADILIIPAGPLLANGIVVAFSQLNSYGALRGSVRLPPNVPSSPGSPAPS
ncbi:MAG TPA: hypothetical protein VJL56_01605 [Candidatus Bathyarchaeia archaeon]|nr:hypothetical protein [Candidatus Bathyarchaeia archaeon]